MNLVIEKGTGEVVPGKAPEESEKTPEKPVKTAEQPEKTPEQPEKTPEKPEKTPVKTPEEPKNSSVQCKACPLVLYFGLCVLAVYAIYDRN